MPHIKVKPFDVEKLKSIEFIDFVGNDENSNTLAIVNRENRYLLLNIFKRESEYLIKQNRVLKHEDILFVKESLNLIANKLNLEILHKNTNIKPFKPKIAHKYLKSIEYFYQFKTDFNKIALEIGFGSGKHLLHQAKANKDTLFIGIEIHTPSINQVLKQITIQEYKNIFILKYDGRLLLEMLNSNILDKIYVHFPVPWDKKPHRRVISKRFLEQVLRVLKKKGSLELRTDSENYYSYALELFENSKNSKLDVIKNEDLDVVSKYEARWKKMKKNIYNMTLTNLIESENIGYNIDFDFDNLSINDKIPTQNIIKDSLVNDDYFVHFGAVYKDEDKEAIECSFGSFSANEKKILCIDKSGTKYIPTQPVKSIANSKAHQLIREVLNGKCN